MLSPLDALTHVQSSPYRSEVHPVNKSTVQMKECGHRERKWFVRAYYQSSGARTLNQFRSLCSATLTLFLTHLCCLEKKYTLTPIKKVWIGGQFSESFCTSECLLDIKKASTCANMKFLSHNLFFFKSKVKPSLSCRCFTVGEGKSKASLVFVLPGQVVLPSLPQPCLYAVRIFLL